MADNPIDSVAKRIADFAVSKASATFINFIETNETIGDAIYAMVQNELHAAPQPSPSDEVRGLIERLHIEAREHQQTDEHLGASYRLESYAAFQAVDALARLSTPPSSPVSGEGDETPEYDGDGGQHGPEAAPSRPPEPAASGAAVAWRCQVGGKWLYADNYSSTWWDHHAEPLYTRPPEGNARAMREALEFYAEESRYEYDSDGGFDGPAKFNGYDKGIGGKKDELARDVIGDGGERARRALALPVDGEAKP